MPSIPKFFLIDIKGTSGYRKLCSTSRDSFIYGKSNRQGKFSILLEVYLYAPFDNGILPPVFIRSKQVLEGNVV